MSPQSAAKNKTAEGLDAFKNGYFLMVSVRGRQVMMSGSPG